MKEGNKWKNISSSSIYPKFVIKLGRLLHLNDLYKRTCQHTKWDPLLEQTQSVENLMKNEVQCLALMITKKTLREPSLKNRGWYVPQKKPQSSRIE